MRIVHIVIAHNSDGRVGWEGQRHSSSVHIIGFKMFSYLHSVVTLRISARHQEVL